MSVESITVTAGERSVTLDAAAAERVRRNLRAIRDAEPDDGGLDYVPSDEVTAVASRLIGRHLVLGRIRDLNVAYLLRNVEGEPDEVEIDALAKAGKAPTLWHDVAGFDAYIWVDARYWTRFTEAQREAVVLHELLHIEVTDKGTVKMRKHDVEDFTLVVRTYGAWRTEIRQFAEQLAIFDSLAEDGPARA